MNSNVADNTISWLWIRSQCFYTKSQDDEPWFKDCSSWSGRLCSPVVQKCSYFDILNCWTVMWRASTVSWSKIRSQCFTQKRTMSVNNRTFAIARHQFTLTICPVYSKQPELTPCGRLVLYILVINLKLKLVGLSQDVVLRNGTRCL